MKTKKQAAKAQAKAQAKSAKIAAKKAAAENSMEILKENSENDKKRKPSLIPKKKPEHYMIEQGEKSKKSSKQTKRDNRDKKSAKKVDRASKETSKNTNEAKPNVQQSYEETQIHDVQRYLETLPSPEIRDFIERLILQDKFNILTVDIESAVGDLDRMRYYFQKDSTTGKSRYDPNGRCLDGGTPLHAAIKAKKKETIQLLIENGADLSLVDFMGDNAIMAAIKAGVANMINLLWPYKANLDVNHQNTVGKTALHLATERSWEGCARFLLSNQAIPDIMDKAGITPLMIAAEKGDMKIVDILIKAGADICIEDEDYDTSVSKALFGNHTQVVDYMLTSLDDARREFFVKDMMCKVMNPPLPDGEYALPETQYIPILEECTKHGVFRDSFYNQKVVQQMMMKMTNRLKQPETVTQICCLVMAMFFRFGNEIDKHFVRQFVQSRGTELVISLVQMYISEWSFTAKDALQIFLPLIGLVEIPEGRTWLYRNILDVSEFFNHFEKNFLNNFFGKCEYYLWCSETNHFKEINRVWIHFYNEVNRMQTVQREKHMLELLKDEEREKDKREKRLEKIKQRKEDKIKKLESTTSEFLKSWTDTSIEEEDEDEEEDEVEEEAINTCRNSNAIMGFDKNDTNQGVGNGVYNPYNSSQTENESKQLTNPNGEIMLGRMKKVNDEDWTTVQTKKNKEKDKQINERPKVFKYSPSQNSKSKNLPAQKQKKKKEAKTKTVPLNLFAKPLVASSPGNVRWADIAKGATKDTPHIEANDKRFPRPIQDKESTDFLKRKKENQEAEFPCLNPCINQTSEKEKPNKMTFHFHSDQPASREFDIQFNESDDEIIDIEEAEKELQILEGRTSKEIDTELSVRMSHTGECFMNDPEYTDDTKPNLFDPTNLTDEEINTLNIRGKTQGKDVRPPVSEYYQLEINSTNSSFDSQMDTSKQMLNSGQLLVNSANLSDEKVVKEQLLADKNNIQGGNSMSFEESYQTRNVISVKQAHKIVENESANIDINVKKMSTKDQNTSKAYAKRKSFAISSISDGDIRIPVDFKDLPKASTTVETSLVKAQLTEEENQLLEHQEETYGEFEQHLEMRESEHFMELTISVSPVSEPKHNTIDDLFKTPGEIPEWMEDEEEIPKGEEVWDKISRHPIPLQQAKTTENKETEKIIQATVENFKSSETLNVNTMPKLKSPCDLLSSDPAIIHCIKQPGLVDEVNDNIANAIKKELETNDTLRDKDKLIEPLLGKCKVSSRECKVQTQSAIDGKKEMTDCMENQNNVEKQTAVIKPLGLVPGSNPPATNCAFGQKLLENACKLEEAYASDDSILYPDDLDGEVYEADDEHSTRRENDNESFCFPSFHEETMLSAHHNKEDVSIAHHIQQLQLEQLNNYYMQCKDSITDSSSIDQSKFLYYAQSAGINRKEIEQYLQGTIEVEQRNSTKERNTYPVLPQKQGQGITKSDRKDDCTQQGFGQSNPRQAYQTNIQSNTPCQGHRLPFNDNCHSPAFVPTGQHMVHTPNHNVAPSVTSQQLPVMPLVPYGVLVPFSRPPMHPATIRNIQSQQAAMSSTVRGKIQEILQSMFKSKVKSVRWTNELSRIRGLPSEKLKVIGKIMIPKDESDIICIGRHCTGVTVLGYLSDGSEIAVKIMDSKFRPLKSDEVDKLLSIDSSQLFINRYRAIEEHAGCYYMAMDLYEYTLPEYLKIIAHDKDIDEKIAVEKLVFQLLRAMLTLHQQYLIVHGELRPENIVIDTDGNLNVSSYGIGRNNAIRQIPKYIEYNDEDKCWLAPEVMLYRQKLIFKTDIWVIGMLIYYIYKGGRNPFGSEPSEIIQNIIRRHYMMEYISEEASNLLGMMLSVNKIERPAVADILKHPMFWSEEKKLRFISIVGSDIVRELKQNFLMDKKQRENSMTNIVSMTPCNISLLRWMQSIEAVIMKDMKTYRQYKNTLVDLVVFVYNCNNHFEKLAQTTQDIVKEPGSYFLKKFPTLFMTVYRAVRFSNRKDKTCYKPFF